MGAKKQWLYQGDKPLWQKVTDDFIRSFSFGKVIVVADKDEMEYMKLFGSYTVVEGGGSRHGSLKNAIEHVKTEYILVNDVARCCIDTDMVNRVIQHKAEGSCIVPTLNVTDTLYLDNEAVDRDQARLIQTPQLSRTETLRKALSTGMEYTDESSAINAIGGKILFVEGSDRAHKLTRQSDIRKLPCLIPPSNATFTGFGIDIHPFESGKQMKLCGIEVESPYGFRAHSDGDVAIHALIDALMGAAGLGDIGELFPDNDDQYAGADSTGLLGEVMIRIRNIGFDLRNIDLTILAQAPKILPYKHKMREQMARLLALPSHKVNIKATTAEKLGFVGRKEGVTVHAVATLGYFNYIEAAK
jgi:2-C-methyl-D-erythritol 4-phosphate cytidylyltransferase/2-C-methyl-D-erythritol 2,4-cyclodiphosphate synthase